jgi:anti-sigma factor RsiW
MTSLFEDHLSLDAVVAFADGELGLTAFQRAAAHIAQCSSCATEVAEQTSARQQLRSARCPSIPSGLLDSLRSIPLALPLAPPPAGLSRDSVTGKVTRDSVTGKVTRDPAERLGDPHRGGPLRSRGFRLGAGAIVAGLAMGALAATALADQSADPGTSHHPNSAESSYQSVPADAVAARSGR